VTRGKSFMTPDGHKLTPDFIVSDSVTPDVVVMDFKNSLAATAVASVTNRLKEYNKGIAQVEAYITAFSRFPHLLDKLAGVPNGPRSIKGLLLFRIPMPLPVAPSQLVGVDDWFSLERRLQGAQVVRAGHLLPPDCYRAAADDPRFMTQEIKVGEWTYRRCVLFWPGEAE
jgi:hypothetical protein